MQKRNIRISTTLIILSLLFLTVTTNSSVDVKAWEPTVTPVCVADGNQVGAKVTSTTDGGVIVAWLDNRGIYYNIYAQKFDSRGNPQWTLDGVPVCNATNGQSEPFPLADSSGGAYILWMDYRSGTDYDIYAQRLNSSGNPQWTLDGIPVCDFSGSQQNFDVCTDGLPQHFGPGGIIVTWEDQRAGSSSRDIYAQRIALNGTTLWSDNGVVICDATESQTIPKIVPDYNGGAFVSWTDRRSGSTDSDKDIYYTKINSDGVVSGNGIPVCSASGEQTNQLMINGWEEDAIIMWTDYRDGDPDIYVQYVNKYQIKQWGDHNGLAVCTADGEQIAAALCKDGNYGAILSWLDDRDDIGSFGYDVYAQHVNRSGVIKWTPNGTLVCNAEGQQNGVQMISDGNNGAILAWQDPRTLTETSIYAQRIDSSGSSMWGVNGTAVDPYPNEAQMYPSLALVQTGEAVITWQDSRGSSLNDIWGKYMIDYTIPSSTNPPNGKHQQGSTATITWSLYDNSGGGYYKVRRSIPESIHSVDVIPWTEWDHGDTIIVPVDTTEVGVWFYMILYNDSNGNGGIFDSVLINITARPPSNPDLGPIIVIAAVSGCAILGVVVFIVIKKKRKAK